jgi:hypothetical protein
MSPKAFTATGAVRGCGFVLETGRKRNDGSILVHINKSKFLHNAQTPYFAILVQVGVCPALTVHDHRPRVVLLLGAWLYVCLLFPLRHGGAGERRNTFRKEKSREVHRKEMNKYEKGRN